MAPGCLTNIQLQNSADTIDSFEILEQTVIKQKRLAKKKKSDLRLRILLKRTFDLVCEIMDRENGFSDDYIDNSNASSNINNDNYSNCSSEQVETSSVSSSVSSPVTITTTERSLELIPLPPDDYESQPEDDSNSVQMVPDEQIDNVIIKLDDHKEYHMLINVQTDFFNRNNENNFKRKFDDGGIYDKNTSSSQNNSNNKKLKLVDIIGSTTKVNKNEV